MELVEYYRLRRTLAWFTGLIVVGAIVMAASIAHLTVNVNGERLNGVDVPLSVLAPLAMSVALIFATIAGTSLNKDGCETLALSWTKPVARASIGARFMLVDLAAVLFIYALSWVAGLGVVVAAGFHPVDGGTLDWVAILALGAGIAVMWYGLEQAATAYWTSGARGLIFLLWIASAVLNLLSGKFGGVTGAIVTTLNVINPLAYLRGISINSVGVVTVDSFWQGPLLDRALVVYVLAAALCALAVALWTRREA